MMHADELCDVCAGGRLNLHRLQGRQKDWSEHNFPEVRGDPLVPLAGMTEELGELAHALLKQRQGIRTNEDHDADAKDAIGDLFVYAMELCNRKGWSLEEIVENTCENVFQRDWRADPVRGGSE